MSYYRGSPMPVLMARYHAPTGALYVRWLHQYDPYLRPLQPLAPTVSRRRPTTHRPRPKGPKAGQLAER
jgi:hypothetical protein